MDCMEKLDIEYPQATINDQNIFPTIYPHI